MTLAELVEARVGHDHRRALMQRLRQAELDVLVPFDAEIDGESVRVLAVWIVRRCSSGKALAMWRSWNG